MKKFTYILLTLILLLVIIIVIAIFSGHANILELSPEVRNSIFVDIRLPRILAAIIVGSALSVSGHIITDTSK